VDIYDPWADPAEVEREYGLQLLDSEPDFTGYNSIILAVAHDQFKTMDLAKLSKEQVVFDIKGVWPRAVVDKRL
jgi:UDP-N-acetyl-D-galactosamine dehydrogenase